jgi:hypothetical protein
MEFAPEKSELLYLTRAYAVPTTPVYLDGRVIPPV